MNFLKYIILVSLVLLFSCGGFVGGVSDIVTKKPEKRIQRLERELADLKATLKETKREKEQNERQLLKKQKELVSLESDLKRLENENQKLQIMVNNDATDKNMLLEKIKKLQDRIKSRKQSLKKVQNEIINYNTKTNELQRKEVGIIRDMEDLKKHTK